MYRLPVAIESRVKDILSKERCASRLWPTSASHQRSRYVQVAILFFRLSAIGLLGQR